MIFDEFLNERILSIKPICWLLFIKSSSEREFFLGTCRQAPMEIHLLPNFCIILKDELLKDSSKPL